MDCAFFHMCYTLQIRWTTKAKSWLTISAKSRHVLFWSIAFGILNEFRIRDVAWLILEAWPAYSHRALNLIVSYHVLAVYCRIARIGVMFHICKHIIFYGLRILSSVLHITDSINYKSTKLTNYFGQIQTPVFLEYSSWDFRCGNFGFGTSNLKAWTAYSHRAQN